MEEDLVTNTNSQPRPSGQDGHLEPSPASSDLTPDCASPTEVSPTASMCSSEDIKAAETADLSSVPLDDVKPEGVMVDNVNASPGPSLDVRADMTANLSFATMKVVDVEEDEEDTASEPFTTSSSTPVKDLVMHMPTSGTSREGSGK